MALLAATRRLQTQAARSTLRTSLAPRGMPMAVREKHYLLNYEYVDGMLEKREPYRSDHLARVKEQYEKGVIKTAGAYGAAEGAVLHFECDDKQLVEDFAQGDPYLKNGLITSYKIHEWALVFPEQ